MSLSRLKPVIDFLVEKGLNKELPTFFEVTPSNIVAHQEDDYFVSELIKLKSDYEFKDSLVNVSPQAMNKDNVTVSWTGLNVAVQVIKKGDDGKLLAGVEFNLEDTNGKVIATQKSDKDGKVVFSALKEGN
ncbi:hypothetical protein JJB63_15290 [Clostridium perfringens]|uniref:MSCRAMM family protein n=1 Tax=Clostridium perfringens TaxID=1502 RepID=UPI001A25DC84|nr:prealbumin-like fold domain-containing protein [Clostridium perfringens]MBO3326933.1 hypothetical protein [Clostridium perfringens]HAT4356358.1 hypothetical protein [Clostridium perfringens]HJF35348.1 prealbumin-like fold domain-containing protein [Clostridium perfringens]